MSRGAVWKISVTTTTGAEEAVAELLGAIFGQAAAAYTDFETGGTTVAVYCEQRPTGLFAKRAALRAGLARIKNCGLNVGAARISARQIRRENWAESWKRHFKPIEIGDALLVKPSWIKRRAKPGQAVVVLDPGLSFGTGQHPTTEFCLRQLVRIATDRGPSRPAAPRPQLDCGNFRRSSTSSPAATGDRSRSLLDIGTGSGILAIAAAKLGYAPVHAFDFDPQSVRIARSNARANRVQRKLRITRADLTKLPRRAAPRYDFVCANLLANLLISERDRIIARLKPTGTLVVAGILKREFAEVAAAFKAAGFRVAASKAQKEWRSGTFTNRILPGAKSKS